MIARIEGNARRIAAAALFLTSASVASAAVSASDPFLSISAQSGPYSGTYSVALSSPDVYTDVGNDPAYDLWFWSAPFQVPIMDGSHVVATLVSMTVLCGRNTQPDGSVRWGIDVDYSVLAGSAATTFQMVSPTLYFDTLNNATATTSSTRIGSDQDFNGILIGPSLPNGYSYEALYNGANMFHTYFNTPLSNVAGGSVNGDGNMSPAGAFVGIGGPVSNMQSIFAFNVSANDSAGGTSTYSITPAPGAIALMGFGALLGARRRR
jgi:MYXO-CTERM domain-containing protein